MIDVMVSTRNLTKNEWLEFRKSGIGGSDVATICGLNKYKSPLQLWLEKTGQIEPEEAGEAAYWGNVLEGIVRNEFTKRSGLRVNTINSMLRHKVFSFMIANVDGIVIDDVNNSKCIFEAKTASAFKNDQWDDDKIPEEYILQVQHYLAVTGFNKAYIAALIGGNKFIYKVIVRDDELIDMIIQLEYNFWNCVENNIPPAIDGSNSCSDLMSRLYPSANNVKIILPDNAQELVEQYNVAKEQEKLFSEKKEEAVNKLKSMLGENEIGIINDTKISWKNVITDRLDSKKLKIEIPDVYEKYISSSSSRRFVIK